MNQKHGNKKGLSPIVLLLLLITVIMVTVITLGLRKASPSDTHAPPPRTESTATFATPESPLQSTVTPPVDPPIVNEESVTLSVQSKNVHFNSGGEIVYGYPTLTIKDAPDVSARINTRLTQLVEEKILPIIEQMAIEDTPDAYRCYNFTLRKSSLFYSIVVTVDISEGITFARELYGWNFISHSGEYVSLTNNCYDKKTFANTIDGCIENVASYDQIIHQWLVDTVTAEHESNEFSFYFENENMIAVLNKHLRLNSFDRDPILITVPYEKIQNVFPINTKS